VTKQLPILIAAGILALFAVAGTSLVAFTYVATEERIAANEREALLISLYALVPPESIDNDIATDTLRVDAPEQLGPPPTIVYRGRKQGRPVAAVLTTTVPNGYGGPIKLLVAVRYDGVLGGVRVISHKETPGLGDKVDETRSDWIFTFAGKSLGNPPLDKWKVKRDGGVFDQFTGATITPRAVVTAVRKTLIYVGEHRDTLYQKAPTPGDAKAKG
jgi:electron transport complex protein RnfG